ncbi:MAG: hypothetical protein ACKOXR_00335 [Bacteroidota bacterium]
MFQAKGFTVFILFLVSHICYGQYDGLNGETKKENTETSDNSKKTPPTDSLIDDYEEKPSFSSQLSSYKAIEFMTNGSQYSLFLCFDPQAGVSLNDRLFLGGGVNLGIYNTTGMGGAFGFSRISFNKIFFQAEYRAINTFVPSENKRDWVSSPILLVGFAYDESMSSWASVGISVNGDFSRSMPFGALVYRFGVRF